MSAELQRMIQDLDRRLKAVERDGVKLRKGRVTDTSPAAIIVGGECGATEIPGAPIVGEVTDGQNVPVLQTGSGATIALPGMGDGTPDPTYARKNEAGQVIDVAAPTEGGHAVNREYLQTATDLLGNQLNLVNALVNYVPEVSSLPASPYNGYTCVFNGWFCRYDASPAFPAYPWTVLGGVPIVSYVAASETVSAPGPGFGDWAALSNPVEVTLPAGIHGVFDITVTAHTGRDTVFWLSYAVGSTAADHDWGIGNEGDFATLSREHRHTVPDPGSGSAVIRERYRIGVSPASASCSRRRISAMPRVIGT